MWGPENFHGRKIGVLMTSGADANIFNALREAAERERCTIEIVAPRIGGVEINNGTMVKADQIIDGGPSVLYDAVVLLVSDDGVKELIKLQAARDFVNDALAHLKFIGYQQSSKTLLAQIKDNELDGGCILLEEPGDTEKFIETCRKVRFWDRMGGVWRQ